MERNPLRSLVLFLQKGYVDASYKENYLQKGYVHASYKEN